MLANVLARTRSLLRSYRWRWLDPAHNVEEIPVGELVASALRSGSVARPLRLYLARRDLAARDFPAFVDEARAERFYDLKFVARSVRESEKPRDPAVFAEVFADKVRQAIEVCRSMGAGFDLRYPIEVRVTDHLLPPVSASVRCDRECSSRCEPLLR